MSVINEANGLPNPAMEYQGAPSPSSLDRMVDEHQHCCRLFSATKRFGTTMGALYCRLSCCWEKQKRTASSSPNLTFPIIVNAKNSCSLGIPIYRSAIE